jgi:hypothetical protein
MLGCGHHDGDTQQKATLSAEHARLAEGSAAAAGGIGGPDSAGRPPSLLFCDNETDVPKVFGGAASTPYPKDGFNDHVVNGAATVNPERRGTKMACWHHIGAGETAEIRLRLAPRHSRQKDRSRRGLRTNAS